ncbi:MAG: cysteine hydrolase [Lachnospiraceae bacterium]|nr:cysteine hydrolase [Lachnospiraceae bacterium]
MEKLLIVVDMQNDFVTGVLGTNEAQAIVSDVANYVKNFDGKVIFTRDTHDDNYLETQEGKKLPVPHCIKGSNGWQIVPELLPFVNDSNVIDKPTFGSLALSDFLKENDFSEIELCGVCTGICVISNAVIAKATRPNTPVSVLSNLCACVTPDSHNTALEAMKTCHIDII